MMDWTDLLIKTFWKIQSSKSAIFLSQIFFKNHKKLYNFRALIKKSASLVFQSWEKLGGFES